jgi:hypothetical protein
MLRYWELFADLSHAHAYLHVTASAGAVARRIGARLS